jgi:hypothetical protein
MTKPAGIPERLRGLAWDAVDDVAPELLAAAKAWASGEVQGLSRSSRARARVGRPGRRRQDLSADRAATRSPVGWS